MFRMLNRICKIIFSILVICFFSVISVKAMPVDAGFLLNRDDDPIIKALIIVRNDSATQEENKRILYENDILYCQDIDRLSFQLNPGFHEEIGDDNSIQVVADASQDIDSIWQQIIDYFRENKYENQYENQYENTYEHTYSITFGNNMKPFDRLQPGCFASLIVGEPVTFAWDIQSSKIVFFDTDGNIVYQKNIKGQYSITVRPEEIGLKAGKHYTWKLDNTVFNYEVAILDTDFSQRILKKLAYFDNLMESPEKREIKKAAYLQLISDRYGNKADLYWLSYQIIKGVHINHDMDDNTLDRLEERVKWHWQWQWQCQNHTYSR